MQDKFEFAKKRGQNNFYCPTRIEEQDTGGYTAEIVHFKVTFGSDGAVYPELGTDYHFSGHISGSIRRKEHRLEHNPNDHDLRQRLVAMRIVHDFFNELNKDNITLDEVNEQLLKKALTFRDIYLSGEEVGDVSPFEINNFLNISI